LEGIISTFSNLFEKEPAGVLSFHLRLAEATNKSQDGYISQLIAKKGDQDYSKLAHRQWAFFSSCRLPSVIHSLKRFLVRIFILFGYRVPAHGSACPLVLVFSLSAVSSSSGLVGRKIEANESSSNLGQEKPIGPER
jgi:hypothetical protein